MIGKICMVTGATSGIGLAAAEALARHGASVIVVGRNEKRCARTVEKIIRSSGNKSVSYLVADLSLQRDIHLLVSQFRQNHKVLDVLINNAGGKFIKRQITAEGIEHTFALNHLGYFLLTNLLLPELKASKQSRVINIASGAHSSCSTFNASNLQYPEDYDGKTAYAQSKLANLHFTYELARRLKGTRITVNAVDPGCVITNFSKNNGWISWTKHVVYHIMKGNLVGPKEGAWTALYLATSPEVESISGKYFSNMRDISSSDASYDKDAAERLWQLSLAMTGIQDFTTGMSTVAAHDRMTTQSWREHARTSGSCRDTMLR